MLLGAMAYFGGQKIQVAAGYHKSKQHAKACCLLLCYLIFTSLPRPRVSKLAGDGAAAERPLRGMQRNGDCPPKASLPREEDASEASGRRELYAEQAKSPPFSGLFACSVFVMSYAFLVSSANFFSALVRLAWASFMSLSVLLISLFNSSISF